MLFNFFIRYKGATDAFLVLLKERGMVGMWKGWLPNVQRGALVNFGGNVFDFLKHFASFQLLCKTVIFG